MIEVLKIKTAEELTTAHEIRHDVFVVEQAVDEGLEYEFEEESVQLLALVNKLPAGTARWRKTANGIKLERFAVRSEFRSAGVGSALLETILNDVPKDTYLYLHAQLTALGCIPNLVLKLLANNLQRPILSISKWKKIN